MRIAMIGHKRIPGREGGIEVVVEELSIRMAKLGHDVFVYNRKTKNKKMLDEYQGVHLINIPTIENKNTDAVVYSFLATLHAVICRKYDVIHYHALGPSVMLIIPRLLGIKVVVTVHGLNYKTPKWNGIGAKYIKLGEKIAARFSNEIIVLSYEQKKYFKQKYNRDTIYIPNGTIIKECKKPNIIKKRWGLEQKKYILLVSRVVPGKGIECLVKAYRRIKTNLPLIIAGDSKYVDGFYENLKKEIDNDHRIKLIGFVEGQALQELYSNALLFVFPSEAEGMPMCLLEALSYNLPCLVSDIPENREIARDYVSTFRVGDIDDLYTKLQFYIENPDKIDCYNSRQYIEKHYKWEMIVDKTLECYRGELC